LVVAGSRNPITLGQLRRADAQGALDLVLLSPGVAGAVQSAGKEVLTALISGSDIALTTGFSEYHDGKAQDVALELGSLTRQVLERSLEEPPSPVGGLFLTGGDVARAVAAALDASALRIWSEVQPGVPLGTLVGGPYDGLPIVTKAGGFGDENTIIDATDFLKKGQ
jgi:uncharacterized protein YgbK (DUF1537 family)